jgi:hypothetical protein
MTPRLHSSPGCLTAVLALALASLLPPPAAADFRNETNARGLGYYRVTWSAAFADLDLDWDLDLYSGHHFYSPVLFWNDGTGVFNRYLHPQPWQGDIDRHGVLLLSLDEDDDPDIIVLHGGGAGAVPEGNELYRNDGRGSFVSVVDGSGLLDEPGRSRCVSAADFDGDSRVDLYVGKAPNVLSPNSLFRNEGGFVFTDVAADAGLDEFDGTVGGLWGDYDDDGDLDLFLGGEEFRRPSVLYRNDQGKFEDVSALFIPPVPIVSGADWGDADNDGDIDLAVCDGSSGVFDTFAEGDSVTFFVNTAFGDTGIDGLTVPSTADTMRAVLRRDAYLEIDLIFLGPHGVHPPVYPYINLTDQYVGAPDFTPGVDEGIYVWRVAPGGDWEIRCSTPLGEYSTYDGWLTDGSPITGTTPYDFEDPDFVRGGPRVWRNDGGTFLETTSALGLPTMLNPRDISWVDYDNDGDLDLHVVDKGTTAEPNAPDHLFRNDGTVFTDQTFAEGVEGGDLGMGDGGVWGDVDADGDLDLYLQEGAGPRCYSAFAPAAMYINYLPAGESIQLDLVGTASGVPAIGARVTSWVKGRVTHRRVSANSWRGFQDPLRLHLGIAKDSAADSIRVEWPSGLTQVLYDVPAGIWRLAEGGSPTAVSRPGLQPLPPPDTWGFAGVIPQPARSAQTICLYSGQDRRVVITIHDIAGRRVRSVYQGWLSAGETRLLWDGRDEEGRPAAAGVYYLRGTDGTSAQATKLIRIR